MTTFQLDVPTWQVGDYALINYCNVLGISKWSALAREIAADLGISPSTNAPSWPPFPNTANASPWPPFTSATNTGECLLSIVNRVSVSHFTIADSGRDSVEVDIPAYVNYLTWHEMKHLLRNSQLKIVSLAPFPSSVWGPTDILPSLAWPASILGTEAQPWPPFNPTTRTFVESRASTLIHDQFGADEPVEKEDVKVSSIVIASTLHLMVTQHHDDHRPTTSPDSTQSWDTASTTRPTGTRTTIGRWTFE